MLVAAVLFMAYLNAELYLRDQSVSPPPPPDPMTYTGTMQAQADDDAVASLLSMPGLALDRDPADLPPYPGAQLLHRFARRGTGLAEETAVYELPGDTPAADAAAHYTREALARGFSLHNTTASSAARRLAFQNDEGGALIIRLAPRTESGPLHATAWLRYSIPPDTPAPAGGPPSPRSKQP